MKSVSNWKIEAIRILDVLSPLIAGAVRLARLVRINSSPQPESCDVLIIRPGGMGDLICLVEAINNLGIEVNDFTFLIEKRSEAFATKEGLNYVIFKKFWTLRKKRFTVVIDSEPRYGASRVIAQFLSQRTTIVCGFRSNRASNSKETLADGWNDSNHAILQFRELISAAIAGNTGPRRQTNELRLKNFSEAKDIQTPIHELSRTGQNCFWYAGGANRSRRISGSTLVSLMNANRCSTVIVSRGEASRFQNQYGRFLDEHNIEIVITNSLTEAVDFAAQFDLVVTIDGGAAHLACFYGFATHVYFTSGNPAIWFPWNGKSSYSQPDLTCAPCNKWGRVPPCGNNFECLQIKP